MLVYRIFFEEKRPIQNAFNREKKRQQRFIILHSTHQRILNTNVSREAAQ